MRFLLFSCLNIYICNDVWNLPILRVPWNLPFQVWNDSLLQREPSISPSPFSTTSVHLKCTLYILHCWNKMNSPCLQILASWAPSISIANVWVMCKLFWTARTSYNHHFFIMSYIFHKNGITNVVGCSLGIHHSSHMLYCSVRSDEAHVKVFDVVNISLSV
mgnify:FL=1